TVGPEGATTAGRGDGNYLLRDMLELLPHMPQHASDSEESSDIYAEDDRSNGSDVGQQQRRQQQQQQQRQRQQEEEEEQQPCALSSRDVSALNSGSCDLVQAFMTEEQFKRSMQHLCSLTVHLQQSLEEASCVR
ncbi:unnamed protein product, partial [Polarella glacialis]